MFNVFVQCSMFSLNVFVQCSMFDVQCFHSMFNVFGLNSSQAGHPILSQNIKIRDVFVQCSMFNVFVQCSMFSLNVFVQCSMFDVQCFHSMFNVFGLNSSQAGHPILSQNIKIQDVFVQCSMFNV